VGLQSGRPDNGAAGKVSAGCRGWGLDRGGFGALIVFVGVGQPVGAALAAMRRKAQRANARQSLAVPPLRAGARIAAEAAPTCVACGMLTKNRRILDGNIARIPDFLFNLLPNITYCYLN